MKEIDLIVSKNLTKLREDKHLKKYQVAKALGISESNYSRIENGKIQMNYDLIVKLADFYDVSIDDIFGRIQKIVKEETSD